MELMADCTALVKSIEQEYMYMHLLFTSQLLDTDQLFFHYTYKFWQHTSNKNATWYADYSIR